MKKLITVFLALTLMFVGCTFVSFSDINEYTGSVILKITPDSTGTIKYDNYLVRQANGGFATPTFEPIYKTIFKVGDTIK